MIEKLACKLGRNDEAPNIQLAVDLCQNMDSAGIAEIVAGFRGKDKSVANDCIKVLYEIGSRSPSLICIYVDDFLDGLRSNNNRLVWGSMAALAHIVELVPDRVFSRINDVVLAYERGSVITVDNSISVFAGLCRASSEYSVVVLPIVLAHLGKCRPKDVPQHAERASVCFSVENANEFAGVLRARIPQLSHSGQARLIKLMARLDDLRGDAPG
ncbi:MAG: hypothetical protein FWD57_05945 [Polyangiaceae bacterium]|nr:hypothetical protein [Polyangiaceae bacterium]